MLCGGEAIKEGTVNITMGNTTWTIQALVPQDHYRI